MIGEIRENAIILDQSQGALGQDAPVRPKRRLIDTDELRRLAAAGLTLTEIAADLGCDYDSVWGVARRNKIAVALDPRSTRARAAFWEHNDAKLRQRVERGDTAAEAAAKLGVRRNAVIGRAYRLGLIWAGSPEYVPPAPRRRIELPAPGHCQWADDRPGEAGFHFCGDRTDPGRSFCPEHHRRAWRPAPRDANRATRTSRPATHIATRSALG